MIRTSEGMLLRIFIGDSDRHEGQPLHKVIVQRAYAMGLAGATVLHGPLGFGRHSRMHTAKILRLSEDLPVLIEIVDADERIRAFLPELDAMVKDGLITLETVHIIKYQGNPAKL